MLACYLPTLGSLFQKLLSCLPDYDWKLAYTVSLQHKAGMKMSKGRSCEALIKVYQGWVSHLIKESKFNLYLLSLQTVTILKKKKMLT